METQTETKKETVDLLNSFLRGEMSAVETYHQAIGRLTSSSNYQRLTECMQSHQTRVGLLKQRILQLGSTPSQSSGPWGSFVKLLQAGANLFGEKAAIAALEEGEDHGRDDYLRDVEKLDAETRQFIESQILPEQQRTHATLASVKHTLH